MQARTIARVLFAAGAAGALGVLVRHTGTGAFLAMLRGALPWLPVLLALEAVRIATDILALRSLSGPDARRLSWSQWTHLHLAANAALVLLPAGRAVSEGMKIARLGPTLGRGRVAALVTTQHVATLVATALTSGAAALVCVLMSGRSPLALALSLHAVASLVFALTLRGAMTRATLPRSLARWLRATPEEQASFRATARALPALPLGALVAKLGNRTAQVAQFGLLLLAVGASSGGGRALVASGVNLLGGLAGELSFAQLGATDGAFALSAPALSLGVGAAIAIATLTRVVQLSWSAVGGAVSHVA